MMKHIYILLVAIIFGCSFPTVTAQSLMTNAEIYDFNIGDIFEIKTGGYSGPPNYRVDTIINKYYSAGMDTVFYVSNSHSYTYPGCPPPCTGSSSSLAGKITYYTHLDDTVGKGLGTKPSNLFCIDTAGYTGTWVDTTYQNPNFCNTLTTQINFMTNGPLLVDSCYTYFEPYYGHDTYGKGLGWINHYYNTCSNGSTNCQSGMELVYYKKGSNSCGTYVSILVTGIHQTAFTPEQLNIYPNPTNGFFTISWNGITNVMADLYDINGRHVLHIHTNAASTIDASGLDNGVYTLAIKTDAGIVYRKLVITR